MTYPFKYFTISELLHSNKAVLYKIANKANKEQEANLFALIENVLDPVRAKYGKPILVSSGFRCADLNAKVNGETHSQHQKGEAADILIKDAYCKENLDLARTIITMNNFDQLILEEVGVKDLLPKWVHVSWKRDGKNRHEILKKVRGSKSYVQLKREAVL